MKVLVDYSFSTEVDIPEEEIKEALTKEHLVAGDKLAMLVDQYSPQINDLLRADWVCDAEITGVYNPMRVDPETGTWFWENRNMDEIIWEG